MGDEKKLLSQFTGSIKRIYQQHNNKVLGGIFMLFFFFHLKLQYTFLCIFFSIHLLVILEREAAEWNASCSAFLLHNKDFFLWWRADDEVRRRTGTVGMPADTSASLTRQQQGEGCHWGDYIVFSWTFFIVTFCHLCIVKNTFPERRVFVKGVPLLLELWCCLYASTLGVQARWFTGTLMSIVYSQSILTLFFFSPVQFKSCTVK